MASPPMFKHEAPKSTKTCLKNKKEAERIESFAVYVFHHEIAKISLFQPNPFFPPSAAARSIQFNLIPIKVPLVHTEVI